MTSSSKQFATPLDDAVVNSQENNLTFAMSSRQGSYNIGDVPFSDQSGISNILQGGSDQSKVGIFGSLLQGNLGYNLQTSVLDTSTEILNILQDGSNNPLSVVSTDKIVTVSEGTTGDLTTIIGAQRPGQRLFLYNIFGNTITIKNTASATENTITTPGAVDFTLSENEVVQLVYDITTTKWRIVGNVGGGGSGGVSFPIRPPVDNRGNQSGAIAKNLNQTTGHVLKFTLTGDATVSFSGYPANDIQQEWEVEVTQDGTGGHDVTDWGSEVINPPVITKTADATSVIVFRTNDGGTTVRVGNTVTTTAGAKTLSALTIDADKDWQAKSITNMDNLEVKGDITSVDRLQMDGGTSSATSVNDVVWYLDSDGNLVSNVNATDGWIWSSGNISKMILTDSTLEKRNVTAPVFQLYNTRTAANGTAATINFLANSANTSTGVSMGFIIGDTEDLTGDGIGGLKFGVNVSGTPTEFLNFNDSSDGQVNILKELDMTTHKIVNVVDPTADQDGATKKYVDDNAGLQSSIIDSNSSLTISDTEPQLRLSLNATQDWLWQEDLLFVRSNSSNYATSYLRNTGAGVASQLIATTFYQGNNAANDSVLNYVTMFSSISDVTGSTESGLWTEGILSKGSDKTSYTVEGGVGLINTNILHSLFGSMILKSDQDGDEAVLRLERNDTTPSDNNEIGTIQFRGEDSGGNETEYGNIVVESSDVTNLSENGRFAVDLINGAIVERMIVADSLTNDITFAPTSSFNYTFDTTGLEMIDVDASPANDDPLPPVNFVVNDSGVKTTYAQVRSEIRDVTDAGRLYLSVRADNSSLQDAIEIIGDDNNTMSFMNINSRISSDLVFGVETGGTDLRIYPAINSFNIAFDNVLGTTGTVGSFALPFTNTEPTSDAEADTAFGTHEGQMGISRQTEITSAHKVWSRDDNGKWGFTNVTNAF